MKTKTTEPTKPHPVGWNLFDEKTSIFTKCSVCGKKVTRFFFRHIKSSGDPVARVRTEIKCGPCLWRSGDGRSGPAPLEW